FYGINPFMDRPTAIAVKRDFPKSEWLAQFAQPAGKAAILAGADADEGIGAFVGRFLHRCYDLGARIDYEPAPDRSVVRLTEAAGRDPWAFLYDLMVETSEHPRILVALNNYR